MQNLVFLAIIVAGLALGVGYMNNQNGVDLWVQQIGVGQTMIDSGPVPNAALTILIDRTFGPTAVGDIVTTGFKDFIVECVFRSPDIDVVAGSTLICKLIDGPDFNDANVIAEGIKVLQSDLPAGTAATIPINMIKNNDVDFVENIVILIQNPPN